MPLVLDRINEYVQKLNGVKVENHQTFLKWNSTTQEKIEQVVKHFEVIIEGVDKKLGRRAKPRLGGDLSSAATP